MTEQFFCSEACYQAGESPIGMASTYWHYVLVECPLPWPHQAVEAKLIPENLRELISELRQTQQSVRFLFISNKELRLNQGRRVILLSCPQGRTQGYHKYESQVSDLTKVAPLVRSYLTNGTNADLEDSSTRRDILICTHGTHDKCCGKYGKAFYQEVCEVAASCQNVRIWQSSHFGGHRFAPTAIDFPQGRFYGFLNPTLFTSILQRSGNIRCLNQIYRGWGILPRPVQVLEKELAFVYGWDWFNYQVAGRILESKEDRNLQTVELECESPDGTTASYRAEVVVDPAQTVELYGSCKANQPTRFTKFAIQNYEVIEVSKSRDQKLLA